jgi:hypothetical protein
VWKAIHANDGGAPTEGAAMPHFGDQESAGNQETPGAANTATNQEGAGA